MPCVCLFASFICFVAFHVSFVIQIFMLTLVVSSHFDYFLFIEKEIKMQHFDFS